MHYQTVLFDLDGTLTDPLPGFARSFNYALKAFGFEEKTEQQLAGYIGPPLEGSFEAETQRNEPEHLAELVAKYRERYLDVGFAENSVYPEVMDTLKAFQSAGQRMVVCTSKPERTARMVLELFELDGFFEFVSGGDVGVAKWMQIEGLVASNTVCGQTLMVGDRAVDLIAGHRNQVHSGGVLWGYGSHAELTAEAPAHLFERPSQWLALLD